MYPRIWSITTAELAECIVTIVAVLVNTTQDPNLNFQFGTTNSDFPRFSMVDSRATCDTDLGVILALLHALLRHVYQFPPVLPHVITIRWEMKVLTS